jgi:predicted DNA-binding protein with PD1-like motif
MVLSKLLTLLGFSAIMPRNRVMEVKVIYSVGQYCQLGNSHNKWHQHRREEDRNFKMKYSQAKQGRVFVLRLEDGETVHEEIEKFARAQSITAAALIIIGGATDGSILVVGPEMGEARPIHPMEHIIEDVHEIVGTGTLFPDEEGHPVLHMHMACGRDSHTVTGCIRSGVKVWQVMEVILYELVGTTGKRVLEPELGFKLLNP